MITTFFRNQILPALKIFSNEDVCAWRETRARTNGHTKFCPQAPFHRRFLQRFLRKTRSVRILRREFTKRKRPNSASPNFTRRFLQRFLRVARNASTHERSVPKRTRPRARAVRQSHTQKDRKNHSHSMVAGGFEVISYTTRFACFTSFTIRVEIFSRTS